MHVEQLGYIIHEMLKVIHIVKTITEESSLTEGQKQIVRGCETRLLELRQDLVSSSKEDTKK